MSDYAWVAIENIVLLLVIGIAIYVSWSPWPLLALLFMTFSSSRKKDGK